MFKTMFSTPQSVVLEQALAGASLRQKIISNNIANVNTPGFKRSEVSFEEQLTNAINGKQAPLAKTNNRHFTSSNSNMFLPAVSTDASTSLRADGNNVDIDAEMGNMAKNNIYYDAAVQQLSRYFSNLRSVINEGRR